MAPDPKLAPLKPADAKPRFREIVENGIVDFSAHARDEMGNDDLSTPDCLNTLRGGVVEPPEYINGEWRYRVSTNQLCVVVTFKSPTRLRVVTAWRITQ